MTIPLSQIQDRWLAMGMGPLPDAAMAAVWGLVTRGVIQAPVHVLTRTRSREELLGRVA